MNAPQLLTNKICLNRLYLLFILTLLFSSSLEAQIKAFPTALGAGAYARGDVQYELYEVTNLNESGPGSLWEALGDNRIVVFRVSGIIDIPNIISTRVFSNCIVLGQTAPAPGITIVSNGWRWNGVQNTIFRYIRFRTWQCRSDLYDPCGVDNIDVVGLNGTVNRNIIFDHCSFAFGGDEFLSFRGDSHTMTVQNSIFSYGKTGMLAGDSDDTSRGWDFSILNNFWHTIGKRTPNSNTNGRIDVIGNVTYNILNQLNRTGGSIKLNEIGNNYTGGATNKLAFGGGAWTPQIYTANNRYSNVVTANGQDNRVFWDDWAGGPDPSPSDFINSPFPLLNYTEDLPDGDDALLQVQNRERGANAYLSNTGSPVFNLDFLDQEAYDQFDNNEAFDWDDGTGNSTQGSWELIPQRQWLVDSQPSFGQVVNSHDQNTHSGVVPNSWITSRGLNPSTFNPLGNDLDAVYTNIEIYSFGIDDDEGNAGSPVDAGLDVTICEGESTTLTATGSNSYVWNTGETTASINVSPTTTTTYTVTGTSGTTVTTDDVIVTVNELPVAQAGEDETICEGDSVTLTASGGDSYLWDTGETTASITVSPNTTTVYSVTVSQNGCEATDEVQVNVNPLPTANAGNDIMIMQGDTTTLTASGGGTYLWNTGETTQSIIVGPNVTTTYTVTVNVNGCQDSDDVIVTVIDEVIANAGEDQTICEGSEVTLSASGGNAYVWSTGETTQSITVSPLATTTYTVTAIIGSFSDTDEVTVFVNPVPNANAGDDITINEGDSTVLTASGGDSYEWSTGATTQSITVSPTEDTTYTVFVDSNGCDDFDEVIVTVNPAAQANAGEDQTICQGSEVTLTASGGDTYVWSTGETTQSITVSPAATSNYSVIVSNDFSSDTDEVLVTVNPLPNVEVTGDVSIMQGEFVTLSASGANSYQWSNGATLPNIAVSPIETTTYEVTGYINNCSETEAVTVNVFETVDANAGDDVSICFGSSTTLSASGGDSYVWSTGETTQTIEVGPSEDTTYTVIVSNELDSDTDQVSVAVENCGIDDIPDDEPGEVGYDYQIFISQNNPNILNIKLGGLDGDAAILIHDLNGKLLYRERYNDNNGQPFTKQINISSYNKAVYLITLEEQGRSTTKRAIFH